MRCPFCNRSIAKQDSFCRHCGQAIPEKAKVASTPPISPATAEPDEKEIGALLADVYTFILGEKYMDMISKLYQLNPQRALKIMQEDLSVKLGRRPKKSKEEIRQELDEFFKDPETQKT